MICLCLTCINLKMRSTRFSFSYSTKLMNFLSIKKVHSDDVEGWMVPGESLSTADRSKVRDRAGKALASFPQRHHNAMFGADPRYVCR